MDASSVEKAAAALLDAYATRTAIAPLTVTHPGITLADAYAVQLAQVDRWTGGGEVIKGHKVGLTSAAMQRQLGVDQPDYGHLTGSMFHLDAAPIDTGRFLQPRIEPEIAFVLGRPLKGPGVTAAQAVSAVDFVLPSLEIIDSRIADWKITLADTIADNASSGGVVLGTRPVRLDALDLAMAGCLLHRNGVLEQTGAGGAVLGSPVNALVWLANTLGERGVSLEAGHVVLPGSITAAIPVTAGDTVTATFAGIGSVTARFAGEAR
ncbi:fumarylacetoacetate hydrolase family protein [Sphaerisporangium rubeum]|uniref:2-keto-4-pentenoate hydratase n=1 Tax=Sphaerisporangium rubeum TaxID=321317 RepID=A0A7X0IE66_9ACTN|nr:2-keto-4-pentenoate hydratase [Sphaerisporangium rubeum]MBB6473318.1 2-keto-4-pentenoate hydratase [Sphaerisporangium rubeum]